MQCIWHKLARDSSSGLCRVANCFATPRLTPGFAFLHPSSLLRSSFNRNISRNLSLATPPPPSCQPPLSFRSNSLPPPSTPKPTPASAPLALSRLALSATKAVHISLRDHALEDAFLIVNSIRYAALPESHRQAKSWATIKHSNIRCPPGVSPRLPAHALLHGLVRIGMPQQASELATTMMNTGIRVNGKTLTAILNGLTKAATVKNASSNASDARLKHHIESLLGTSKILTLKSSMTSDPNTAFALELLHAARESGSRRTGAMFNTLITLCLINGEIIVASLLFGALVKDWEARSQTLTRMTTPPEAPQDQLPSEEFDRAYRYSLLTNTLQPTPGMLKAITVHIQERLARATPDDGDTPEFQEALQSLAILASLVDERQLPFPQLSGIIKTLAQCPMTGNWVWVTSHDKTTHTPAYRYFHKILIRLTASLPTKSPSRHAVVGKRLNRPASIRFKLIDPIQRMQPPLDHHSYNTLMHYALQSRFSPKLAKQVYEHLTVKRDPPLPANQDTFNILFRSAALYKRRDIISKPLQTFGQHAAPDVWKKIDECRPNISRLPGRLKLAGRQNLPLPSAPAFHQVLKNNYTLATHLSSLISCGQSRLVVRFMYQLFPIFESKRYHDLPDPEALARQQKWLKSLARAVAFGPHVLGTFLHAIVQHGVTKKSHRLFNLIAHAAKASHDPAVAGKAKPWSISVPIYTTMLQAYKKEFNQCHRKTGTRIFSYLLRKTATLYEMVKADIRHNIPEGGKLDSRFYNALLKVLAEYLPTRRTSVAEASNHLEHVRQQYAKSGFIDDRGLLPLLEEVLADMEAYGYPIPVGFQHLLVGKRVGILKSGDDLPEFERRPFAFSKARRSGGPYTLPVCNTKSLTIIRRNRRTRIHNHLRQS
ncbi:hypothetical protein P691DRAFT_547520 [Macrolepiota fuliginosa MF-IS2]|uniref:Pentatricopeptide repeat-containing protein n=1 Tax=Macrolepiota fuliginosa MF-IS2 TaxID=1400762 RepID=A0A9P6C2G4_9AGAR|nr:hypothetical protein P691DRAFT_547520 [Macrolepiota fuliginosa MF-IS2]